MDIHSTRWLHLLLLSLILTNFQHSLASILEDVNSNSNKRSKTLVSDFDEMAEFDGISIDFEPTNDPSQQFINNINTYADKIDEEQNEDSKDTTKISSSITDSSGKDSPEMKKQNLEKQSHNTHSSISDFVETDSHFYSDSNLDSDLVVDNLDSDENSKTYQVTDEFSVLIDTKFVHDESYIDKIAKKFNCQNLGKVLSLGPESSLVYYRFKQNTQKNSYGTKREKNMFASSLDSSSVSSNSRQSSHVDKSSQIQDENQIQDEKSSSDFFQKFQDEFQDGILQNQPLHFLQKRSLSNFSSHSSPSSSRSKRFIHLPRCIADVKTLKPKIRVKRGFLDISDRQAQAYTDANYYNKLTVKTADEQYKYNEQQRNKQQQNKKNNNAALQSSLLSVPLKPSSDASKFLTRNKRGITDSITEFFFGSKQKNASPPPQSSFQKDDQKQVKTPKLPEIRTQPNTVKRSSSIPNFNDPLYQTSLWYYKELNVTGAWNMGYTGKGVVLTVLDDGLEHMHPDLDLNYDEKASYDVNDQDQDPSPRYTRDNTNKHGTRCAGVISAEANNSVCIPGIAYHSKIGGIRMLDGTVNDQVEARSISHESNHVDIYSSSWGPDDDGKTVDGPGYLTQKAFQQGVKNGRKGKGNIYVWASGNGGRFVDSCAADGYANSIYTVSTSSASHEGRIPWYNEPCASTLATAYSSNNNNNDPKIATTDIRAKCTDQHTGTSAAAPMVAGIIALALEANPDLTWRDIQSLLIKTAKPGNLLAHDWRTNGVGRSYSHNFGYGLINAGDFVSAAIDQKGKQTAEQRECEIDLLPQRHAKVPHTDRISIRRLFIGNCKNGQDITNLEHVVLTVSLSFARRGDVEINLISPDGTLSKMHPRRPHDNKPTPYNNWPFMSVHFWDEQPYGSWSVEIKNAGPTRARGIVHKLKLKLYGTYNKRKHRELLGGYDSIAQKIQAQRNEEIDEKSTISTESFDSGWNRNGGGSSIGGSSASSRLDFSYFLVAMIVFFWFGKLR